MEMGLFDALFGRGDKRNKPKQARKAAPTVNAPVISEERVIKPEIIAAICASINVVMDDDAELIAAVAAAIIHSRRRQVTVLRIKRASDAWAAVGRQKLMDARQSV